MTCLAAFLLISVLENKKAMSVKKVDFMCVTFEKDNLGKKFNSTNPYCSKHYWTFHKDTNGKAWSFVKGSIMAENILDCEERLVYKVIAEYFSN